MISNYRPDSTAGFRWKGTLLVFSLLAWLLVFFTGCRRDLYVLSNEEKQIELITDWSLSAQKPTGMTWWFIRNDNSGYNRYETTAQINHSWVGIPRGEYTGFIFDYSPAEYSHFGFVDMNSPETALMLLRASADQPQLESDLFGEEGVPPFMTDINLSGSDNGLYLVSSVPEDIHIDTLKNVSITTGSDDDYILYDDRDKFKDEIVTQTLHARPQFVPWKVRVMVHVNGINRLYGVRGSVAGLADGCWLSSLRPTSTRCLQSIDSWKVTVVDSVGTVSAEQNCMGLPDMEMPASPLYERGGSPQSKEEESEASNTMLRLNLRFLMRDKKTTVDYHYDFGPKDITIYDEDHVIVLRITSSHPNHPDLPFVDADDSTGFDASVSEWTDGGHSDTTF